MNQLKQRMRGTWMAGDFGQIARYLEKNAEEFVDRFNILPGMRVLDVACGTGNVAIPAARKGACVTGIDIAPNLVEQARQRAVAEGLEATFDEGDAEQLPYPDAHFDVAMTMFGAMFAPRPEQAAAELTRVCRHGGTVAMANWTPTGFVGKMFAVSSRYVPPPEESRRRSCGATKKRLASGLALICRGSKRRLECSFSITPSRHVKWCSYSATISDQPGLHSLSWTSARRRHMRRTWKPFGGTTMKPEVNGLWSMPNIWK